MTDKDAANEHFPGSRRLEGGGRTDPTPDTPERGRPPPLESAFEDDSARERLYSVLVQTRDPIPAATIAERAGCHTDTARKYLDWFAQLGLAIRHDGRPVTYERNEAYFEWRYVSELTVQHTLEDLREHVRSIQDRLEVYRDEYGADDPSLVDAREAVDEDTSLDDVWGDLANWATLEDELRLHERARQRLSDRPPFEAIQG